MGEPGGHGWMGLAMVVVVLLAVVGIVAVAAFFRRPVEIAAYGAAALIRAPDGVEDALSGDVRERDSWIVIPDISGYTRFISLTRFAAGHAQFVVAKLLEAMMAAAQPPLTATRVEGDSVMFHAFSARDDGETGAGGAAIAEAVVRLVEAFYETRASLAAGNLCPCEACKHIADLEIKVVVHHGAVVAYRLRGLVDLSGIAVIEAHRLLKNTLDAQRYVLVTEAAAADVRLPWSCAEGLHTESYAEVGELRCVHYPLASDDGVTARDIVVSPAPRVRDLAGKLVTNARAFASRSG